MVGKERDKLIHQPADISNFSVGIGQDVPSLADQSVPSVDMPYYPLLMLSFIC